MLNFLIKSKKTVYIVSNSVIKEEGIDSKKSVKLMADN